MATPPDAWLSLARSIEALGLELDAEFEPAARFFLAELNRWSRGGRLTGYRSEAEQVEHLLLESLLLLAVLPAAASPLLDIGTGPGVPGLVLKLARPDWQITLIEGRRRPCNFVRHVARARGLTGVAVEQVRAEAAAEREALRGAFRSVTVRAVAAVPRAGGWARPFLREDGCAAIALGPRVRPEGGEVSEVSVRWQGLLRRRRFLIIHGTEGRPDVPRETTVPRGTPQEGCESRSGGGQPEGWRGKDHDRDQSRGRARGCGAADPPR